MPRPNQRNARKPPPKTQSNAPFEVVDPVWLLKALGLSLLAALLCVWLAACLLFYQGSWQLILHPSLTVDRTPASVGLPFEPVHFDAAETGQPRLSGWWIPAQAAPQPGSTLSFQPVAKYAAFTVLYLHDGSGSLSATVPMLAHLHQAGINVFAIDYRGFGRSDASSHPTEATMAQDAAASLDYLVSTRHIPARTILPYGAGLGASLAANLVHAHPEIPAVILDNPDPDPTATAVASHPSHFIPIRLLFHEHFDVVAPLAALAQPKLLIAGGPNSSNSPAQITALQTIFRHASSPSRSVTLTAGNADSGYQAALTRFFDEYLSTTPSRGTSAP